MSCLDQSPADSLEGEQAREWLCSLSRAEDTLPSIQDFHGIRSCSIDTCFISIERRGYELSLFVP